MRPLPRVESQPPLGAEDGASAPAPDTDRTKRLDITKDPETLDLTFEGVSLMAASVALIFFGYFAYNLTRLDVPGVRLVMWLDWGAILIAGLVFWTARTLRPAGSWVHAAGAILALSVAGDTALSSVIYGEGSDLQYLIAVALGGAAITISTRWYAFILLSTGTLAVWAAYSVCPRDQFIDILVVQFGASMIGVVVFLSRVRWLSRLLGLRLRDARTTHDLKRALARAEREFQEHQAIERRQRELVEQLRQAQKLEALGTLAGGVAHDINNVIGAITAIASTTVHEMSLGAQGRRELQQILAAARRGTNLTRNLIRFARQDQPVNVPFNLDEIVIEVEALLRRTIGKHVGLSADCQCAEWAVMGDAGLMSHVLMNLCLNAADAIVERGEISIRTRVLGLASDDARVMGVTPGDYLELTVSDNGKGMSPEVLERAFEPFFSTKESKRRSGLGLPMVYGTIQQHGGGLKVHSQPGVGTSVRIVLPAVRQSVIEERRPASIPQIDQERSVALFVDDEPLLRRAGKRMLSVLGYKSLLASNGKDALEQYVKHRARIGVIVLDVAMPVMSGVECLERIREIDPNLPIVLASGFPKGHDLQPWLKAPKTRYLRKPYELEELSAVLADLQN